MVQTINPDPRIRICAQNEMSKTELPFLCDALKLRLLSFETWKGASPHKVTLTICANKQQRNARHRYRFARQSTSQIEMQISVDAGHISGEMIRSYSLCLLGLVNVFTLLSLK